jgi:DNA-binding CsgD family transcriptional regulator
MDALDLSGFRMTDGQPDQRDVADTRARLGQASPGAIPRYAVSFGQGDLAAGVVASVSLLLLVFALDLTLWLAIPLAIATYVGVALLRPGRERQDATSDEADPVHLAYEVACTNTAALRALEQRVAKPAVREQVGRIVDRIDQILVAMREDGNLAAVPLFNDRLLEPLGSLLTEYVRLASRGIKSAEGLIDKTETHDLPMIEQAVDAFCEQLNRAHVVDLEALGGVLDLNLRSIAPVSPEQRLAESALPASTITGLQSRPDSLTRDASAKAAAAQIGLTRRELEILPLLAQRLTDREISERLCISPRTAMNHTASILDKLGVSSRRDVAAFAAEHGLLPPTAPPTTGK